MIACTTHVQVDRLPGFYRQRDNCFYSAWAFVLPVTVLRTPYSLMVAVIWSVLVYFSVNLDPSPGRFFTYILLLFLLHGMGIAMFRAISSATRNETVSLITGCFLFLVLLILGGFLLSKRESLPLDLNHFCLRKCSRIWGSCFHIWDREKSE